MNFKAIETHYSGCRFRSRVEARYAVFFDTLGIQWEYEKEGYVLDGVPYLPDFWLPEQDCFVEIKGQDPSEEERRKAQLLSLYTQKDVFVFYGSIELPPENLFPRLNSYYFHPPIVWKFKKSEKVVGGQSSTRLAVPSHILALLQRLSDHYINLCVNDDGHVVVTPNTSIHAVDSIDSLVWRLNKQISGLQEYGSTIESLEEDILDCLSIEDDWKLHFESQEVIGFENDCVWMECSRCGSIEVTHPTTIVHYCEHKTDRDSLVSGRFRTDSPRLLAAYTAARSARFEHGEKGR